MPDYPTCVFCNRNDSPPSKEDVIPKWIAREFPNARFHFRDEENDRTFGTVGHFGITTRAPCERCNNGWMSHLESKVQPFLTPMLHGMSTALSPTTQLLLSRWLIKTAIMFDMRHSDRASYFTVDECRALMRSLTVPRDTQMFLAVYLGKKGVTAQEMGTETKYLPEPHVNWRDFQTYSATITINTLVLQTFSYRRPRQLRDAQLDIETFLQFPNADVQIWPSR